MFITPKTLNSATHSKSLLIFSSRNLSENFSTSEPIIHIYIQSYTYRQKLKNKYIKKLEYTHIFPQMFGEISRGWLQSRFTQLLNQSNHNSHWNISGYYKFSKCKEQQGHDNCHDRLVSWVHVLNIDNILID